MNIFDLDNGKVGEEKKVTQFAQGGIYTQCDKLSALSMTKFAVHRAKFMSLKEDRPLIIVPYFLFSVNYAMTGSHVSNLAVKATWWKDQIFINIISKIVSSNSDLKK